MKEHHPPVVVHKNHSGDAPIGDVRSNLEKTTTQWPCERHPNGPAKLGRSDILSNVAAALGIETKQPFPYGLVSGGCGVKRGREFLQIRHCTLRSTVYRTWYIPSIGKCPIAASGGMGGARLLGFRVAIGGFRVTAGKLLY